MKRFLIFLIIMICLSAGVVKAQTLKATGPDYVSVGDKFRIEYVVDAESMDQFHLGDFPQDAFKLVYGPATSMSSSMTSINGKTTYNTQLTYIYTFVANKAGTFTFKSATSKVNGKLLRSNDVRVIVSDKKQVSVKQSSSSEVFIKVTASKNRIVEQEPLILTYKIYTSVNLSNVEGELPDLQQFTTYPMTDPRKQVSRQMENINGTPYIVVKWREYLLFPQETGRLEIPSIPFNVSIVRRKQNIDPFEEIMNGGSGEIYDDRIIPTEALHIQVDALADKPVGFSGGVGQFKIKSTIDNTTPKTNEVVTIKVRISGKGNLNMVSQPEIVFPSDFDTYEPQSTDSTQVSPLGIEGFMEYEYTAVPRNPGKYDIPPISFIYYDNEEHQYKTITTEAFHLNVSKGNSQQGDSNQSFESQDDNDIYPIHQGTSSLQQQGGQLFGSRSYLLALGIMLLVFFSLFIIFRQRAIDNADIVKNRGKRANKVATKRLKKAARLMKDNKPGEFYDEVLRALWGYVGDKLNMPVEQLSRDNINERLLERNVEQETTAQFIAAIDECEYERYAPGDPKGNMNKVYDTAITAIEHIENNMKRKVKKPLKATILLCLLMLSVSIHAVTKQEADQAYQRGEFQQAIDMYEDLLKTGVSADVYYNLGNAYYRTDKITQAILNYERALLLSPSDADIRHNLQLAQSKTVDKIKPATEMFFVTWYHSLVRLLNSDAWAYLAIISLALVIVLALLYLFAGGVGFRKIGFFGGIAFFVVFLLSNLFAWQQKHEQRHRDGAVIMVSKTVIMTSPSANGKSAFVLHEGTTVTVTDDTMTDWKQISVSDGRKGWIKSTDIEKI